MPLALRPSRSLDRRPIRCAGCSFWPAKTWEQENLKELKNKNIVIVGGGCGVAPLKGVIEYIEKNRDDFNEVSLFFGYRAPNETLFAKEYERWKEIFNLNISYDKIEGTGSCQLGTEGFVTAMIEKKVVDNADTMVVLCGPPIMIKKTIEILLNKGFKDTDIYLSAERLMYCGIGKCGRCMIHGKYTCLDGAVFRYDELKDFQND